MNILDLNLIANVHSDLELVKEDNLIQFQTDSTSAGFLQDKA
jgi:hypothetical protein